MHALLLSGSPRPNGNCSALLEAVGQGLSTASITVDVVRLHDLQIRPCSACRACKADDAADCRISDDMRLIYPKVRAANVLVIASPIYWWSISAQTKLFLDRCDALEGPSGSALRGKEIDVLLAYGGEDLESSGAVHAIRLFRSASEHIGFTLGGIVHGSAWEAGAIRQNHRVMEQATALGQSIALRLPGRRS